MLQLFRFVLASLLTCRIYRPVDKSVEWVSRLLHGAVFVLKYLRKKAESGYTRSHLGAKTPICDPLKRVVFAYLRIYIYALMRRMMRLPALTL